MTRSRWPCIMRLNFARLVFSQSCSVLRSVVSRRLPIIALMLSLSSATSPRASTWIERVRSPLVTAVATSAMARTCVVRFAASRFTLAVRSFQVPAAPGTLAWPPSRPSTPTSRATRRHLVGEDRQRVGHVVDGVGERRDFALRLHRELLAQVAVGHRGHHLHDAAHLVRSGCAAITFTLSVRSFQVPATPGTCAWPPSLPSVPTSRATRVTSAAKRVQLVHHRVDGFFQLQDFAFHVHRDLARQVAARDRGRHFGDVAHLAGQVGGHRVHVVGQVLPRAGDARHLRLAAELAFGADFARHARHFGGEASSAGPPSC